MQDQPPDPGQAWEVLPEVRRGRAGREEGSDRVGRSTAAPATRPAIGSPSPGRCRIRARSAAAADPAWARTRFTASAVTASCRCGRGRPRTAQPRVPAVAGRPVAGGAPPLPGPPRRRPAPPPAPGVPAPRRPRRHREARHGGKGQGYGHQGVRQPRRGVQERHRQGRSDRKSSGSQATCYKDRSSGEEECRQDSCPLAGHLDVYSCHTGQLSPRPERLLTG